MSTILLTLLSPFPRAQTYARVWLIIAVNEWQQTFINRYTNLLFMVGKFLRLGMSLVFLFIIKQTAATFAGYTTDQLVVFFLTYHCLDVVAQVLYRGVYLFSDHVRTGEFDYILTKPISALFQALVGKPDINDALFLLPSLGISIYLISTLDVTITFWSGLWFAILLTNSLLIATACHILVITIGILTVEVDGVVWLYRDLAALARWPVSIYHELLRGILFFLIPIGVMVTIPAEVLLGLPATYSAVSAVAIGVTFFGASWWLWERGLKYYASASS